MIKQSTMLVTEGTGSFGNEFVEMTFRENNPKNNFFS